MSRSVQYDLRPEGTGGSQVFADIVDDLMQQLADGIPIDVDRVCRQYPEHADALRQLCPVIGAVASLDQCNRNGEHADPCRQVAMDAPASDNGRLGDFRILREIGRGGMGIVYEAQQISLSRRVALKVLPFAALLDDRQLQRFRNEAHAASILRHPRIVNVFHVGCERGVNYYAMDLIEGQSLAEVIASLRKEKAPKCQQNEPKQHPRPTSDTVPLARLTTESTHGRKRFFFSAAKIGIAIADALAAAHREGVIHRDVKPSNLLIDRSGQIFLTDFGLARMATHELTVTGDVVGTLRYMSPEQLSGERPVDHRTDIYSLGLTLYELLVGTPAFPARDRAALMAQIAEADPVAPSRINPDIPRDLETIVLKSIEDRPEARYDSATELADDLQRFIDNRPITARRVGWRERSRRWVARNRMVTALITTIGLLLLGITAASIALATHSVKEVEKRSMVGYCSTIRLAQQDLNHGLPQDAKEKLLHLAHIYPEHRGPEWSYLWHSASNPALLHTIRHQLQVQSLDMRGDQLAVGDWNEVNRVWRLADGKQPTQVAAVPGNWLPTRQVRLLPESNSLVTISAAGQLTQWNRDDGTCMYQLRLPCEQSEATHFECDLSPSQRFLVVAAGGRESGSLTIIDWASEEKVITSQATSFTGLPNVRFVSDDQIVVAIEGAPRIELRSTTNLKTAATVDLAGEATAIAIAPDRTQAAVSTVSAGAIGDVTEIVVVDLVQQTQHARIPMNGRVIRCLEYSHSGKFLGAGTDDQNWAFIFDRDYQLVAHFPAHSGTVTDMAFSGDDQYLVTSSLDGDVNYWSLEKLIKGSERIVKLQHELEFTGPPAFVDAETVCSSSGKGQLVLWNATTGISDRIIRVNHGGLNAVRSFLSWDRRLVAVTMGDWPVTDRPGRIEILELATGDSVYCAELKEGYSSGEHGSFSPDGRYFVTVYQSQITVHDLHAKEVVRRVDFPCNAKCVSFSPTADRAIVTGTNGMIYELNLPQFRVVRQRRADERLAIRLDHSSDGRQIAVVGFDRRINLFDTDTLAPLPPEFRTTRSYLVNIDVSPNGTRALTSSSDGQVQLWHMHSGELLLTFPVKKGWYPGVAFSPDGNTLAFSSGDEAFAVSCADPGELRKLSVVELTEIACQHILDDP